jgi:hypothetical protein
MCGFWLFHKLTLNETYLHGIRGGWLDMSLLNLILMLFACFLLIYTNIAKWINYILLSDWYVNTLNLYNENDKHSTIVPSSAAAHAPASLPGFCHSTYLTDWLGT